MNRLRTFFTLALCLALWGTLPANAAGKAEVWSYPSSNPKLTSFSGSGTASSPYLIQSAQQLANLAYIVTDGNDDVTGKHFKLTSDIYLNDFTVSPTGTLTANGDLKEWTPIGEHGFFRDDDFQGVFDGNGHTIYGLYMKEQAKRAYVGLFGSTEDAVVKNLTLKNVYIYTEKTEASHPLIGALVGRSLSSTFTNVGVEGCYMYCNFNTDNSDMCYGGLIGKGQNDITLNDCFFSGYMYMLTGNSVHAGGLLGAYFTTGFHSYTTLRLTGCRTAGLLMATYQGGQTVNMGGLLGKTDTPVRIYITECLNNLTLRADNDKDSKMSLVSAYNLSPYATEVRRSANLGNITFTSNQIWYSHMGLTGKCVNGYYDCVNYGRYILPNKRNASRITITPGYNCLYHLDNKQNLIVWKEAAPPFALGSEDTYDSNGTECSAAELESKHYMLYDILNADLEENVWGNFKLTYEDKTYTLPIPIACGGVSTSLYCNEDGQYQISSETDLRMLQDMISKNTNADKSYLLTTDLNLSGSEALEQIGDDNHPFRGTFDGNGHVISGLTVKGCALFGNLSGTVKNLALVDMTFTGDNPHCAPLAYKAGGSADASILNCYAGGTITLIDNTNDGTTLAGLLYEASDNKVSIKNSYFRGIMANTTDVSTQGHFYYGLVGSNKIGTSLTLNDCYAYFNFSDTLGLGAGIMADNTSVNFDEANCRYLCPRFDGSDGKVTDNDALAACFKDKEGWLTGACRPVLAGARHYALTSYDGKTVYADAIPFDDESTSNDIWCHELTDQTATDQLLWALPKVAFCDKDKNENYLINCQLTDGVPFRYAPPAGTVTNGQMHFPLTFEGDYAIKLMCLPATLHKSDLPDDMYLLVLGKAFGTVEDGYSAYAVECDSVPAGFPFIVYAEKKPTETIDVVLRGYVVSEPQTEAEQDGQTFEAGPIGTFDTKHVDQGCSSFEILDNGVTLKHEENIDVPPFGAYFDTDAAVSCDGGVMLDENSNYIGDVIDHYKNRKVAVYLKRELYASGWNTLCVPFDMSDVEIANRYGVGTVVEQFSGITDDGNGTCTLNFTKVTSIEAGKCYLIKPKNDERKWIQLDSRTICAEPGSTEYDSSNGQYTVSFNGTFERKALTGNRYKGTYFTQDNTVYKVANGRTILMNGFRCWIETSVANTFTQARIVHADGTTSIAHIVESASDGNRRIYNIQGIETDSPADNSIYIENGRKYVKGSSVTNRR